MARGGLYRLRRQAEQQAATPPYAALRALDLKTLGCVPNSNAAGVAAANNTIITAAIATALANNQDIFVPEVYYVTGLTINAATRLKMYGPGGFRSATNAIIVKVTNSSNVTLSQFSVQGDADVAKTNQRGVEFDACTESTVDQLRVSNCGYDGILLLFGCVGCAVTGNIVSGCGDDGINIGGGGSGLAATTDTTVANNVVENSTHDGIHISDFSKRTTATGNVIVGCQNSVSLYTTTWNTITGNIMESPTVAGVNVTAAGVSDFLVANNVIRNAPRGVNIAALAATRYRIHANEIINPTNYGVVISETAGVVADARVSENKIYSGCASAGVVVIGANYVTVSDNDIVGTTGPAILAGLADAMAHVAIRGNRIRACGGSGPSIYVPDNSSVTHVSIEDNDIEAPGTRGIEFRGGIYFSIRRNRVVNGTDYGVLVSATALRSGLGTVADNTVSGGCSTAGVRVNNYDDVLVERNNVQAISGTPVSIGTGSRVVSFTWGKDLAYLDSFTFAVDPDALTTGEETLDRNKVSGQAVSSTSQSVRLGYFTARKTQTVTQVRVNTGTTLAAATPTLCQIGLFTVAGNGDLTLVALTANDTTLFAAATTAYTRSFSAGESPGVASYDMVAGNRYAVGILVVTGAAAPTYIGQTALTGTEAGRAPQLAGVVSGQATMPGSVLAASVTASGNRPYAALLPA